MKVAHVTLYPPKGKKHISSSGVASYSKNLITQIEASDIEQAVVCDVLTRPETYQEGTITIHRAFQRGPRFVMQLHRIQKKIQPDVIHIQQELALFGGILTAYLLQWFVFLWRSRVVITLHGVVDPDRIDKKFVKENNSTLPVWLVKLAFRLIFTPLMKWSRKIIVHEQYFKDVIVNSYGIDANKVVVIPHGVESLETISKHQARKRLKISQDAQTVLFMGYATGYKGIDLLIEGFAEYARTHKSAYLVIGAGKHPKLHHDQTYLAEYKRLQQKAAALIPSGQYRWEGFIKEADITLYYSASDVSLYPYTTILSSSGPMSFAIGYEKPFLASAAFQDVFADYPQLLFDRTSTSLADKLDRFFRHEKEYQLFSATLKKQRSWEFVGRQVVKVYEDVGMAERAYEAEKSVTTG